MSSRREEEMCINCAKFATPECPNCDEKRGMDGPGDGWCNKYKAPTCADCGGTARAKSIGHKEWYDPYTDPIGDDTVCYECNQLRKGRKGVLPLEAYGSLGKQIHIPFNEWSKEKLQERIKTATSRGKRYGESTDYFRVGLHYYQLISVDEMPLRIVIHGHWREEGATSKEELIEVWNQIHPKRTYESDPDRMVWFHKFRRLKKEELRQHDHSTVPKSGKGKEL